jgi:hypothetical protein
MTSPYLTARQVADLAGCEPQEVRPAMANRRLAAFQPVCPLLMRADDACGWIQRRRMGDESERRPNRRYDGRNGDGSVASTTSCLVSAAVSYTIQSNREHDRTTVLAGAGLGEGDL